MCWDYSGLMTVLNGLNLATGCSALHIPHQEQGLTDVANGSAKTNGSVAVVLYFLCSHHGCLLLLGSGFAQSKLISLNKLQQRICTPTKAIENRGSRCFLQIFHQTRWNPQHLPRTPAPAWLLAPRAACPVAPAPGRGAGRKRRQRRPGDVPWVLGWRW